MVVDVVLYSYSSNNIISDSPCISKCSVREACRAKHLAMWISIRLLT